LFDGFEWTTDHAINACDELFRLLRPFDTRYVLVIRKYADWSRSRRMMGPWSDTFKDRRALSTVTMHLSRKGVPVFYMEDVIRTIKNGCLKFWEKIPPLSREEIELFCRGVDSADGEEVPAGKNVRSAYLRVGRVVSYMTEKCPFRRLALVPSIGSVPLWLLRVLPFLRDRIRTDIRKGILNNARVNIVKSQGEEMHGY
jgi:hypothetical protein